MDRFPKLAIFLRIALAIVPASSMSMQALANSWGVNSPQDGGWEEAASQGENQNTWLNTDGCEMPRSFLDIFAKGASMHFDASMKAHEEIATYQLKGSAAVATKMREACWEWSDG